MQDSETQDAGARRSVPWGTPAWDILQNLRGPCVLGCLTILAVVLAACTGSQERLWLRAPGWSRALLVGNTQVGDPVPIALDGAGNVYFFLIHVEQDAAHPRVVALDARAGVVWDRTYQEIAINVADQPRILWNGRDLDLFWLSNRALYHARLDVAGNLREQPSLLSGAFKVDAYDVAHDDRGGMTVWYAGSRRAPGLYALPPGDPAGEAILVDEQGVRPDVGYDAEGTLHAIWADYPPGRADDRILYGAYAGGVYRPNEATTVLEPRFRITDIVQGPRLGLDLERAYIFWSVLAQTGMSAGMVNTNYVHFPHGRPSLASPIRTLVVPPAHHLDYQAFAGGDLEAGERVPLEPGGQGTTRVSQVAASPVPEQELAIAFRVELEYLMRRQATQVGVAFLEDGALGSYQLLSFTPANSGAPAMWSDDDNRLYVTWLERGDMPGFLVYFASTAPGIRSALRSLTTQDVGRLAAETLFGLFAGTLFLPFVLIWIILPMIVLTLSSLFRKGGEGLFSVRNAAGLVLALAAYWGAKLAMLPGMRDYVPFSAWLPFIPSSLSLPLRLGVPALIAGLGFLAAWYYIYRQGAGRSPIFFMLVYAAVDGPLTMAVYGVLVLSAF